MLKILVCYLLGFFPSQQSIVCSCSLSVLRCGAYVGIAGVFFFHDYVMFWDDGVSFLQCRRGAAAVPAGVADHQLIASKQNQQQMAEECAIWITEWTKCLMFCLTFALAPKMSSARCIAMFKSYSNYIKNMIMFFLPFLVH